MCAWSHIYRCMNTFTEWLKIKEAFIVGTDCRKNKPYNVWGAQSDARGGKGCPGDNPIKKIPLITKSK
jgi:hypothetical protein